MRLENKVAIVTGASVGIGRHTALLFAREGAKVAVNSQSSRGAAVVEEIAAAGGESIFVQGKVEDAADARGMVEKTVEEFGGLDILVNNAGIVVPDNVDNAKVEDWENTFAVNVRGVFLMSKFAAQQMLRQDGGAIVHNASVAAVKGLKDRASYSASKGAVAALTRAMAVDYVGRNIRVNCVNPGTTPDALAAGQDQRLRRSCGGEKNVHIAPAHGAGWASRRRSPPASSSWPATRLPSSPARCSTSTAA